MEARLRSLTGVNAVELLPSVEARDLLNEAYLELCGIEDWSFRAGRVQVTTTPGVATYYLDTAPARVQNVISKGTDARVLTVTTPFEVDEVATEEGAPKEYSIDGAAITFFPTPKTAETFEVRAQFSVAPMSAATDVPLFEAEFHPAVVYRAALKVLAREGDETNRASSYASEYESYVERMRLRYVRTAAQGNWSIGGGWRRSRGGF